MVILITGASHTGKTALCQKLIEKYNYQCMSIDHIKMGLIRSGNTALTPCDDDKLTDYLWPIVREIIKTAIENGQNLIIEGCYVPVNWKDSFEKTYLDQIKFICLVMSENYIKTHFDDIKKFENVVEKRLYDDFTIDDALEDNRYYMQFEDKTVIDACYNIGEDL